MSKIDPELKKKLLKETQAPFKGLRRILWIAFSGSAFLGLLIMVSKIAGGNEIQQNNPPVFGTCQFFLFSFQFHCAEKHLCLQIHC